MRRVTQALVVVVFTLSAVAAPREDRGPRGNGVVKMMKRIVRALGDGIIIPTPAPKP
jgi:hypothetical protein